MTMGVDLIIDREGKYHSLVLFRTVSKAALRTHFGSGAKFQRNENDKL